MDDGWWCAAVVEGEELKGLQDSIVGEIDIGRREVLVCCCEDFHAADMSSAIEREVDVECMNDE